MKGRVSKLAASVTRSGEVWCEPLKIHFPQIYRVVRKTASLSAMAPSFRHNQPLIDSDFSLFNLDDDMAGITESLPANHLTSSDQQSLIVRHHWSELLATAYLQGIEDLDPTLPCGEICETEQAIFTIVKCRTRKSWPSPMIFYLADVYEDDGDIGVQIWEKSVASDGELRTTDIFYG